ncbi:MAG: ring-cleaving dioxygenase [Candidatus Micrarchaeota archaeon]
MALAGIHHITAVTADADSNISFYTKTMGMRMVKLTVNFDQPSSYHLYFGDRTGAPGSVLTFFHWPQMPRWRKGTGQVSAVCFSVPDESLDFWEKRLNFFGVRLRKEERFGKEILSFSDPEGLSLEICGGADKDEQGWGGDVPREHSIRGFGGAALSEEGYEKTAGFVSGILGFAGAEGDGERSRYGAGNDFIDIFCRPDSPRGIVGAGSVHHIAFRTSDDGSQADWRRRLVSAGLDVTPVIDRHYFHSIYFREPGGVLFEIATDGPGFLIDEKEGELGSSLKLPPWLERRRSELESFLPPLRIRGGK